MTPMERFLAKVEIQPNGCWLWTGRIKDGYGIWRYRVGKQRHETGAHRWSLEQHLERPLRPGMMALHHCDTPNCVNPICLYEGTHADNMADMRRRNRQPHKKETTSETQLPSNESAASPGRLGCPHCGCRCSQDLPPA